MRSTNEDRGQKVTTLEERLTVALYEVDQLDVVVPAVIEVVAGWLEDDETRAIVYDGMVATGPMLKNVCRSLAQAARGERFEGDEHGDEDPDGGQRGDAAGDRPHA